MINLEVHIGSINKTCFLLDKFIKINFPFEIKILDHLTTEYDRMQVM